MSNEPKQQRATRPASLGEMVASARSLYDRLTAAVVEFDRDQNSPLGVPNMATPIRALACEGQGNRLVVRLCSALNLKTPVIQVSPMAEPHYCDTIWMGNIPFPSTVDSPSVDVPVDAWIQRRCLVLDHEHERVTLSWSHFLRGIAEKRGYIHADSAVPAFFEAVDSVMLSDLKLSDWMFRKAGGAILQATREVLVASGTSELAGSPGYDGPNRIVSAGMGLRGIFAPTLTQKEYEKRFNDCTVLAARGQVPSAIVALCLLADEVRAHETLFYRRLRGAILLELGNMEASQNRLNSAALHWGKLVAEYGDSPDTYLRGVADKAKTALMDRWR